MNKIPSEKVWSESMWLEWVQMRNSIYSILGKEGQWDIWNEIGTVWFELKEAMYEPR